MRARLAGTVMLSTVVFFVVAALVSVGVLWWSGDVARGIVIGVMCGTAGAFTFGAVVRAMGTIGGTLRQRTRAIWGWTRSLSKSCPFETRCFLSIHPTA